MGQARVKKLPSQGTNAICMRRLYHHYALLKRVPPRLTSAARAINAAHPGSPPQQGSASWSGSQQLFSSFGSDTSLASTDSSISVGMAEVKTSMNSAINLTGLNGCTGIFLFGNHESSYEFTTGAHATPCDMVGTTERATEEAYLYGRVTMFVLISPIHSWALKVGRILHIKYPNAKNWVIMYKEGKFHGYHDYKATYQLGGQAPTIERRFTPMLGPKTWGKTEKWESIDLSPGGVNAREQIMRFTSVENQLKLA